jgi:hypothetical protein
MDTEDVLAVAIPSFWCLAIIGALVYCLVSKTSILNRWLRREDNFSFVDMNMIDDE